MQPRRILVVEDDDDTRVALTEMLSLWGYEVRATAEGEKALALAVAWQPEVVLLGIWLQGMDGYEVARRLRTLPPNVQPMIIALTGHGTDDDVERALTAGCDGHLLKPYEPDRLAAMIKAGGVPRLRRARRRGSLLSLGLFLAWATTGI